MKTIVYALLLLLMAGARAGEERPNVLFLLADDMRPDCIRALGNRLIRTPQLDALVKRGTTFTRAIAANPICTPSRAEMLSGCTGFRCGVTFFGDKLKTDLVLWPQAMKQAGYQTWYVGKWHNDSKPTEKGYDEARRLFVGGMGSHSKTFNDDGRTQRGYSSELFADGAIEFLKQASAQPFFLHVNFTVPHDPREIPSGYENKYDAKTMPLPENFLGEHPFDNGELKVRDEQLLPWPRTPDAIRKELAAYYAMIEHLDAQVGRILEALQQSGRTDNTIVIFASDHGLALGSHGLLGKQNMYEHSLGVPLIFAGPGIEKDQRSSVQCYLRDIYPTVCALAGIKIPQSVQGKSLVTALRGGREQIHPFLCAYYRDCQRAIRNERYKFAWYPKINKEVLYDLQNDPFELKDISSEPANKHVINELRLKLKAWQHETGDPLAEK